MRTEVIHTADPKMKEVLKVAENIAPSRATVLIRGESGTGKELLARYIHNKSARSSRPFQAVNCAAIPSNLLESELFGYEKGAFTGADQRRAGKFEISNGSTFLLDEIGELPLSLQGKLLRVIQEGEVERIGSTNPIKVDVRLVAATNRNLKELVTQGEFREDLYYRLNVIPLEIPPLRSRLRDVELLAQLFLELSCNQNGVEKRSLQKTAINKLKQWHWPGNVRELQNVMERTVLFSQSQNIGAEHVLIDIEENSQRESVLIPGMTVSQAERQLILKTLQYTNQNRTQAAELLGISIRTLRNKINEYKSEGVYELESVR